MTNISSNLSGYDYWKVQVPEISSPANIQDALRLYHHGTEDTNPDITQQYFKDSIAGIITELKNTKRDVKISVLPGESSLNDYKTTGIFLQGTDSLASLAFNYPVNSRGGLLRVEQENGVVFQYYHDSQNNLYSRAFWGSVWTSWEQQLDGRHNHDALYYRKDVVDNKPTVFVGKDQSGNQLVAATRKVIVSAPNLAQTGPDVADLPSLIPGDLWFW
jgi:hypothetical protein